MEIINKTPHPVNIVNDENNLIHTFPKAEQLIRLKMVTVAVDSIGGIPTTITRFGEPEGLPNQQEGVFYIVSQLVKNALPKRDDLLVPAEVVRDNQGNIVGCKSLGR